MWAGHEEGLTVPLPLVSLVQSCLAVLTFLLSLAHLVQFPLPPVLLMQGLAPPGGAVFSYKWLLDSVGGLSVRPMEPYRMEL